MPQYRKAPVIERIVCFHAKIDEETFEVRMGEWKEAVSARFPVGETILHWLVTIGEKDGMPFLGAGERKLFVQRRFWDGHESERRFAIDLSTNGFTFHLASPPPTETSFSQLEEVVNEWGPKFAGHFGIKSLEGVSVHYINLISSETLPPPFATPTDIIVRDIVKLSALPQEILLDAVIVPPFDIQTRIEYRNSAPRRTLSVGLSTLPESGEVKMRLQLGLIASTLFGKREINLHDALHEMNLCHELILKGFEALFTEGAKQTFLPL